ncbi:MAG: 3-deoxy-D-manno-octulosonic acid transferase [Deltaproteobacteria bacterium]|nr:3-deoxy-D-manno-octulosonic acid transferase [Deltaproteobacteria bacterium]
MNILYFIYRVITSVIFVILIIPFLLFVLFSGKYRRHLIERFGFIKGSSLEQLKGMPKIWVHAVSLGEVKVANSIITSLKGLIPGSSIILSTSTEHGRALALELLGSEVPVIYSPLDFFPLVKNAISRIKPDILIFLETEIWPSWIIEAQKSNVRIAMLNGRISGRSIKRYRKVMPFFRMVLSRFDLLSMISEGDRTRIIEMGARAETVTVNGNAKYEMLIRGTSQGMNELIRRMLHITADAPVIVAGSIRTGEEEIILEAYKKIINSFHNAVLILAPRHLERIKELIELIRMQGLKYHLRSELVTAGGVRTEGIIIVDCFGELFNIYSAGNIAFCGASLVPLGGQNPLEPAAWGTPVFHGPHMEDFSDAMHLLKKHDADIEVQGAFDLAEKVIHYLNNPEMLAEKGRAAKKALMESSNVAETQASLIKGLIENG